MTQRRSSPTYDVLVVGAGHAGVEAALAAHRLGRQVALLTLRLDGIAQMSCNPAIGGVGKGHLVREIDALGGAMGAVADATAIQARRLNTSRGPAVRSTRVQSDAQRYKEAMRQRLVDRAGLQIIADEVVDLRVVADRRVAGGQRIVGVVGRTHGALDAACVIITTGTFLSAVCHTGQQQTPGGRAGDAAAHALAAALRRLGLTLQRFKTGTTPRLDARHIDWSACEEQLGDTPAPQFSFDAGGSRLAQRPCYLTHTTPATHAIVRDNLHRSALYGGQIAGTGPRYCPSLEDKVVRFVDKPSHLIYLEPEGLETLRIYPNGLSTSLPLEVQQAFIRSIPGLAAAVILQPGYAVEYDYAPPTQLTAALMTKACHGLFLAGQINGTSGYEEAAAQGLMAGLGAARLSAEYRLTLREGNAEARLAGSAAAWGLIDGPRQQRAARRDADRRRLRSYLEQTPARHMATPQLAMGGSVADVMRRPDVTLDACLDALAAAGDPKAAPFLALPTACRSEVEDAIKYVGYMVREQRDIARLAGMESVKLPPRLSYSGQSGLSAELQEKLQAVRPATLGQASRISGMTPAALQVVRMLLRRTTASSCR